MHSGKLITELWGGLRTLLHKAPERDEDKRERETQGQGLWAQPAGRASSTIRGSTRRQQVSRADSSWRICVTASLPPQTDIPGHTCL